MNINRFRYEVSGTYRCEVVESKAREPICLTKSPKAAEMIADALNFDFAETLTDNRDLRERVAELDRLRLEREGEYELLRKQRDEFEVENKDVREMLRNISRDQAERRKYFSDLQEQLIKAKNRLADLEIKMTCGHPLAAAQDGVDPPYCTICAVTKERDRLNDHITWMARDQADNPNLREQLKRAQESLTFDRRIAVEEQGRLRDKLRRVHLALSQIPDLGYGKLGFKNWED
jgi:hypothetical protein